MEKKAVETPIALVIAMMGAVRTPKTLTTINTEKKTLKI